MHCCLWFRSVFRVRGPWPKRYGYHLSIIYTNNNNNNNNNNSNKNNNSNNNNNNNTRNMTNTAIKKFHILHNFVYISPFFPFSWYSQLRIIILF